MKNIEQKSIKEQMKNTEQITKTKLSLKMDTQKVKNQKGITLLILVITIVILLILSGITIGAITGENGIIQNAGNAKEQAEIDSEKEIIETSIVQVMGKNKYGNITQNELQEEINKNIGDKNATVFYEESNFIIVFQESNRCYTIDNNGNIISNAIIEIEETAGDITKGGECKGTSESPYKITCIEDLVALSKAINNNEINQSCYVILTKTLDFNSVFSYGDYKKTYRYNEEATSYIEDENSTTTLIELCTKNLGFIPIGKDSNDVNARFKGTFYGQGYEIQNIYINITGNAGLFGGTFGATIRDLGITGNTTSTSGYAGGIIAMGATDKIYNCYNKVKISGKSNSGGIIGHGGWQLGIIDNCYNEGNIISDGGYTGGVAGTFGGEIINSYNIGDVTTSSYAAGILGAAAGNITIRNCYNSGDIYSGGYQAGGIVGMEYSNLSTVENCYNIGNIDSKRLVSYSCSKGIGGKKIINCYNIGKLTSDRGSCYIIGTETIDTCYYNSNLAIDISTSEIGIIDISTKSGEEFVQLLNSYKDSETVEYPSDWKTWVLGEKGYPVFEE